MSYHKLRKWTGPGPNKGKAGASQNTVTAKSARFDLMLDNDSPELGHHVILAFKLVDEEDMADEHYLNRWAIYLTTPKNKQIPGVYPSGRICHVELIMQVQREEYRMYSINMLQGIRDPDTGKVKYEYGTVHELTPSTDRMHKYHYVTVRIPRAKQMIMHKFLMSQMGAPFNFWGYGLNYTTACKFGQTYGKKIDTSKKHRYTCAELIWAALQIGELEDTDEVACRRMSPNAIYEFTRASPFCSSAPNPFART